MQSFQGNILFKLNILMGSTNNDSRSRGNSSANDTVVKECDTE